MSAFLISFGVIFVAELGDKSQLMAMTFATRYRFWTVLAGIAAATSVVHLISVAIGAAFSVNLPVDLITVIAGIAFLGFGAWTLRGDTLSDDEEVKAARATRGSWAAFAAVAVAFFLAELGDKTMLATVTLATRQGWFGTWVGSTIGMVAADALAIGVGALLGRALPEKAVRIGAAILFSIFGSSSSSTASPAEGGGPTHRHMRQFVTEAARQASSAPENVATTGGLGVDAAGLNLHLRTFLTCRNRL